VKLRSTVLVVAALNFSYFFVEFTYGRIFNSLALISDSIDFLEDASINLLVAAAIGWSIQKRKYVSYLLAGLLLVPGTIFVWNAIQKILNPINPVGEGMTWVGLGALAVNVFCALLIARHRTDGHGLALAAFYSARNDAIANVLIVIAGLITVLMPTIWLDLLIGLLIFLLNAGAAKAVVNASRSNS
jgi:Co/Zn/Cd efflux system component